MRDEKWQRVVDAFRRGLELESYNKTSERTRNELERLKHLLDGFSEHALFVVSLVAEPDHLKALSYIDPPKQERGRWSCREAVAVLRDQYPGPHQKLRGAKVDVTNGGYAFNPYITWLGQQLMRVEDEVLPKDERRMSIDEACLAAWNATPPVARPRKSRGRPASPSQHQGAGPKRSKNAKRQAAEQG